MLPFPRFPLAAAIFAIFGIIAFGLTNSLVASQLTVQILSSAPAITRASEISGTLCFEGPSYSRLELFINSAFLAPGQPRAAASVRECLAGLVRGDYQAVVTDRSTLLWCAALIVTQSIPNHYSIAT